MVKKIGILLLIIVAAAGGAFGYSLWTAENAQSQHDALLLYGNVEIRDTEIAFNGEGRIVEVLVEEGDRVGHGQLIARLETDRLDAEIARADAEIEAQSQVLKRLESGTRKQEIEQARANVAAAEARAKNAQRIVDRVRDTSTMGASSEQDMDDALAQLEVERAALDVRKQELDLAVEGPRIEDVAEARARLASRRADRELLDRRLNDASLKSPSAGIIQNRILEPGEFATPARPVVSIALEDPKWIRTFIPEPDLGKVHEGMKAKVHSDSFPGIAFDGWVGFISPIAEFTPKAVQTTDLRTQLVFEIRVFVKDPANQLRLGQPVTVSIDRDASMPPDAHDPASTPTSQASDKGPK
ncbi:MAG: efflux RND transporter periplasmic adaptor subunit [Phycisphaerales bacterium]|nr:efflux RND transporter periplasmic adaptor subunit [Phycisphaerales bacterium]MCB9854378.1 efflux RND transporter periplasmic adaptor subunit [Phycisphaerales bacterium]MCB9863579.1 efflux RND transporter periplasmic adaptor subunit [Phycisphaerales bacterium]